MYNPNDLMEQSVQKFLRDNADLLAIMKNLTIDQLRKKLAAVMQLNPSYAEEIMLHADQAYLNQPGYAGRTARESFQTAAYRAICQSFLRVKQNCQIIFNVRWETFPEAYAQLEEIDRIAEGREALPPPPPPKSREEQLVDQVKEDWAKLETSKFRAKMTRDPQYRAIAERLLAGDDLRTQATTLVDGSQGFNR